MPVRAERVGECEGSWGPGLGDEDGQAADGLKSEEEGPEDPSLTPAVSAKQGERPSPKRRGQEGGSSPRSSPERSLSFLLSSLQPALAGQCEEGVGGPQGGLVGKLHVLLTL